MKAPRKLFRPEQALLAGVCAALAACTGWNVWALRAVLGKHAASVPVSAPKSMTGHLLGAAGAAEAVLSLEMMRRGILLPTINLDEPDEECRLDYVANTAREQQANIVMSNSFGVGGTNATLVMARYQD